jgi:uncharacterized ferredoxin-like protein
LIYPEKTLTMAVIKENDIIKDTLIDVAKKMVVAAHTAPKARGISNLVSVILTDRDLQELAKTLKEIGEKEDNQIFIRDAINVLNNADVLVLFGTKINTLNLVYCGYCGFQDCKHKKEYPDVPCAFNTGDLGIAIGSAVSVAMDHRIDNRIMYSVGIAAKAMNILGDDVPIIYGIPLSAAAKNPFFDRK